MKQQIEPPLTRADVEQIVEEIVGRVVGVIVGDALDLISARFDRLEQRVDQLEARVGGLELRMNKLEQRTDGLEQYMDQRFDRIERMLVPLVDIVDHHTIDIRALQRGLA